MKLKIEYYHWRDHESMGFDSDSSRKFAPLKLGVVEECKYFMVTEIRERSIMVAKKEGNHVSLGTYSDVPVQLYEQGFGKPEEIFVGGHGVEISSSYSYNGNEYGDEKTLYLVED